MTARKGMSAGRYPASLGCASLRGTWRRPTREAGAPCRCLNSRLRVADASGMEASDEVRLALRSVPLPHLGQALAEVVAAFEARPLLGMVLVDATPIALVEGAHGH